jgi:hypothetical protein
LGEDLAVAHDADAAAEFFDGGEGELQVGLIGAGEYDVVGVVAYGTGDSAGAEVKILEQAVGDRAGFAVTLDDGDEAQAVFGKKIGPRLAGLGRKGDFLVKKNDAGKGGADDVGGDVRSGLRGVFADAALSDRPGEPAGVGLAGCGGLEGLEMAREELPR